MSANGKKRDKSFIALLVLIIVCACLMIAAITTLGIGLSNGDLSDNPQSEQGNSGSVWRKGKGAPANDVGVEGDFYYDEDTGNVYCKSATGWGDPLLNMKGNGDKVPNIRDGYWYLGDEPTNVRAEAADGITPEIGLDGYWYFGDTKSQFKAFPTMTSGQEAPNDADGAIGDLYVQTAKGSTTFYQKGTDKKWKPVVTVETTPATDVNGSVWHTSSGDPETGAPDSAKVGDFYLDVDSGNVYLKGASGWGDPIGNLHMAQDVKDGVNWLYGSGNPNDVTSGSDADLYAALQAANVGDLYIEQESGTVYKKGADNNWTATELVLKGEDGNKWYSGGDEPGSHNFEGATLHKGDVYFNTATKTLYTYDGSTWGTGTPLNGKDADPATQWYVGSGAPADIANSGDTAELYGKLQSANVGDFYLDASSGTIYTKKTAGDNNATAWESMDLSLKGGDGNKWYSGDKAPTQNPDSLQGVTPQENDVYFDTASKTLYVYDGSSWGTGTSLKGDAGNKWYSGDKAPTESPDSLQGVELHEGDVYFNTSTCDLYKYGKDGWGEPTSLKGTPGAQWHVGSGTPNTVDGSAIGDYYLDGASGDIYKKVKAEGNAQDWEPTEYSLKGGDGNKWYSGDKAPTDSPESLQGVTPQKNDVYFDTASKTLYVYDGSTWGTGTPLNGKDADPATQWYVGSGAPADIAEEGDTAELYGKLQSANVGDFYLDASSGMIYTKKTDSTDNTTAWESMNLSIKGESLAAQQWLIGNGAPKDVTSESDADLRKALDAAKAGDLYIDGVTGTVYKKGADNNWTATGLVVKGDPGNKWYSDTGAPTTETPSLKDQELHKGDRYFAIDLYKLYTYDGEAWDSGVPFGTPATPAAQWLKGEGAPKNVSDSRNGDYYIDITTGNIYQREDVEGVETWNPLDISLQGTPGTKWYHDEGEPTADTPALKDQELHEGDYYFDTNAYKLYIYGASGWGDGVDFGVNGTNGLTWHHGSGAPSDVEGAVVGDFYLDELYGVVYYKSGEGNTAADWTESVTIKAVDGTPGTQWYHGDKAPSENPESLQGVKLHKGDYYFDTTHYVLYTYNDATKGWDKVLDNFGKPGENGTKWHSGDTAPETVDGSALGDYYLNESTGELYVKVAENGVAADWDYTGLTLKGQNGSKWYSSTGAPTTDNTAAADKLQAGDVYFDKTNKELYIYTGSDWGDPTSLKGDRGTQWYHGETEPTKDSPAGAQDGDYYFDSSSKTIYIKENGEWKPFVDLTPAEPADPHIENGEWWVGDTPTGIPARGEKGEDGKTPYIGENGNWWIDGVDQNKPAVAEDGKPGETPSINGEGYWQIGDYVTPYKAAGEKGEDGTVWHSDAGKPVTHETDVDGEIYTGPSVHDGDFYLDTLTGDVYVLDGDASTGTWDKIVTLRDTITNVHGAWYLNGKPTGFYVSTWHTGAGDPNAVKVSGVYGDLYLDILTGDVYVSNAALGEESASWTKKLNIKGERGNYLYSGKGEPVLNPEEDNQPEKFYVADAKNGDMYLNTVTGDIYQMQEGAWVNIFSTKGDKGDRGSKWFNGKEVPTKVEGAVVGDYYFETKHGIIYSLTSVDAEGNQTWQPVNSDDPLAGTKWLSGEVDPADVTDEALKALLDDANDWDVYFNTVEKTIWQKTPQPSGTSEWKLLGHLTDEEDRGTVWYYGTYDPILDAEDAGFIKATEGHIFGDFYLQTYYPFSGYKGFRIYIFEDDGHDGKWNMHVDMRSNADETNDYEIPNYDALRAFRDSVNGVFDKANDYTDKTVTLTGRVTIPEDEDFGMVAETADTPFKGTFNGGEKGLYIEGLKGPLFGCLEDATIENLELHATLDEETLATFALNGKTSLLTNTFGIAKEIKGETHIYNVTLILENANGTVLVEWDGSGNVSVTVTGKGYDSEAHRARASADADDYITIRGQKLLLGDANFTFEHVKFEDNYGQSSYIDVTNAKSLTLKDCYADVNPVEACGRNADGKSDGEGYLQAGSDRSGNAAFIVSRPSSKDREGALKLTVENSTILSAQSTADNDAAMPGRNAPDTDSMAILINTNLETATITGNVFGAEGDGYTVAAVKLTSMEADAKLTISGNQIHGASGATAFILGNTSTEAGSAVYVAEFEGNIVHAVNGNFLSVTGKGHAQIYLLGKVNLEDGTVINSNTLNDSNDLYKAVKTASEESFDFIGFKVREVKTTSGLFEAFEGRFYLGSNFGAGHQFTPENLRGKVTPDEAAPEIKHGHNVWIVDLAFEDPEGFVQHVADYTDHYYVNNVNGLKSFRDMVNGTYKEGVEAKTFQGKTVVQTDDIDLKSELWTPIAVGDSYNAPTLSFRGTYDGGEHSISNIKIVGEHRGVGLFGSVTHNGAVENLTLDGDIQIEGFQDSGALVGYADHASISNITINAKAGSKITANYENLGGVVGNSFGCTLTDITSNLDVETDVYSGGIIGKVSNGKTTINGATYSGTVSYSAASSTTGGIVGFVMSYAESADAELELNDVHFTGTLAMERTEYGIGFSGLVGVKEVAGTTAVEQEATYNVTIKNSTSTAQYEDSQYHWSGYQFNTTYDPEGNATKEALISTGDALALVSLQAQFGYYNYEGITLKLTQSVDMTDVQSWNFGKGAKWYPIGTTGANPFKGTFDGQGYTISGFVATVSTDNNKPDAFGLFGNTDGATIKNLVLDGVDVTGTDNVGAVIGVAKNSTLIDVSVYGTVTATPTNDEHARSVGGLVGAAEGLTLNSVTFNGTIDNKYTKDNLNFLVYNYGLVGSALEGEATDEWAKACGETVLPAANVEFDGAIAVPQFTGSVNAHITATDLDLSASFGKGSGNVYGVLVTVKSDIGLANVAELVNHGITFKGETVMLGKDIDMLSYQQKWVGIGNETHAFEGTFSGGYGFAGIPNYKIAHLYGPLFGYTDGATVQNVILGDAVMQSNAALITNAANTTVTGVTIDAFVQQVGDSAVIKASDVAAAPFGIVGTMDGETAITSTNITIAFELENVTFTAKVGKTSDTVVTYTGNSTDAKANEVNVLNNEYFVLKGFVNEGKAMAADYTFTNLHFVGDSFIKVVAANVSVSVKDSYIDVLVKVDSASQNANTGAWGFIEGKSAYKLIFENNIAFGGSSRTGGSGALIIGWSALLDGSSIKNNQFGSEDKPYTNYQESVIKMLEVPMDSEHPLNLPIEGNTFYMSREKAASDDGTILDNPLIAVTVHRMASGTVHAGEIEGYDYTLNFKNNKFYDVTPDDAANTLDKLYPVSVEANRTCTNGKVFFENTNKIVENGTERDFHYDDIRINGYNHDKDGVKNVYDVFAFVGYNVVYDGDKITKGDFILGGGADRFHATDTNATEILKAYVKEGCEENIHVVIGEQFGRKLSDILGGNDNTYYNFSLVGLNTFVSLVNTGAWSGKGAIVKLADELNGSHVLDLTSYTSWTPIGNNEHAFKGTFDGSFGEGNWQITGLTYSGEPHAFGFFGYTADKAVVKNVNVNTFDITITGETDTKVGAVIGNAENTTLENIYVSGINIGGNAQHAGAIVGHGESITLTNITVLASEISVQQNTVGAVIGYAKDATLNGIYVGCEGEIARTDLDDADVHISGSNTVGGVVGIALDGGTFENIYLGSSVIVKAGAINNEKRAHLIGAVIGAVQNDGNSSKFTVTNANFYGKLVRETVAGFTMTPTYAHYGLVGCDNTSETGAESKNVVISGSILHSVITEGFTQNTVWEGTKVDSEYQVTSLDGFKYFRDQVNAGNPYKGENIHLLTDLDLGGKVDTANGSTGELWTPIGVTNNAFQGTFDGMKADGTPALISNIYVNRHATTHNNYSEVCSNDSYAGLFGAAGGSAKFMNFTIEHADLSAKSYVGAVVGSGFTSSFSNITVKDVKIYAHHYAGGLTGYAYGTFENNKVDGLTIDVVPEARYDDENTSQFWRLDNGDKAGGLVGLLGEGPETLKNNTVENAKISAYRDLGVLAGCYVSDGSALTLEGNTVKNSDLYVVRDYKSADGKAMEYTRDERDPNVSYVPDVNVGEVIGRFGGTQEDLAAKTTIENVQIHWEHANQGEFFYQNNAWHIMSVAGLKEFKKLLEGGSNSHGILDESGKKIAEKGFEGSTVLLEANIDLSAATEGISLLAAAGTPNWTPLGSSNDGANFGGTFDGQGHTILNMVMDSFDDDDQYMGFFERLGKTAIVKNLVFENVTIENHISALASSSPNKCFTGILAGRAGSSDNTIEISNITIKGDVNVTSDTSFVGGLVGHLDAMSVKDIHIQANDGSLLKGTYNVGGIAGYWSYIATQPEPLRIDNSDVKIDVEGTSSWVGGVAGRVTGAVASSNVTVKGNLTSTSSVSGFGSKADGDGVGTVAIDHFNFEGDLITPAKEYATPIFFMGSGQTSELHITDSVSKVTNATEQPLPDGMFYGEVADHYDNSLSGYLIDSAAGLKAFAEKVNGGKDFKDEHVFLTADIDLAELGEAWIPIGTDGARFMGTFDGLGHTISNIKVSGSIYVGLFGAVGKNEVNPTEVTIKNLVIAGVNTVTVNGTAHGDRNDSGLLAGYAANVAFSNITIAADASVTVTGVGAYSGNAVGGLIGASQSCTYNDIEANCMIRVNDKNGIMVGGLIGLSMHDSLTKVEVKNAWVDGNFAVGGLIGTAFGSETLTNVTVGGNVYMNFVWYYNSVGISDYYAMVGGLIGTAELDSKENGEHLVTITDSSFNGSITRVNAYVLEGEDTLRLHELPDLPNFGLVGSYRSYLKGAQASTVKITSTSITVDSGSSKLSGSLYGDDYILTGGYNGDGFVPTSLSISSAVGLRYFASLVNSGIDFAGATVTLERDIDLGGVNWTAIGNDSTHAFKGAFDGKGHKITGLVIEGTTARYATGLFGNLNGATVQDLIIEKANINAPKAEFVGVLASGAVNSHITNVAISSATLTGGTWVGGVVGHISGETTVTGCEVIGGELKVQNYKLGGVVGFIAGAANVSGNLVDGVKLTALAQSGDNVDDGYGMIGGLVGGTEKKPNATVSNNVLKDVTIDVNAIGIDGKTPGSDGALQDTNFRVYERYTGALVPNSGAVTYSGNTGSVTVIASDAVMTNKGLSGPCGTKEGEIPTFENNDIEVTWNGLKVNNDGYYVPDEAGLKTFRDMVNGGQDFNGETVYLEDGITLNGEWTPIGTKDNPFKGTFDGQNNTISGLTINNASLDYAGLFGYIVNGTIENLNMENVSITAHNCAGAVVGSAVEQGCRLINITVTNVTINGTEQLGGLVGNFYQGQGVDLTVKGDVKISGNYKLGGLAGVFAYGPVGTNLTVNANEGSYVKATHKQDGLEGDSVGGVIGFSAETNNAVYTNLSASNLTVSGTRVVGGIIGRLHSSKTLNGVTLNNVTVSNLDTPEAYIKANSEKLNVGGVVGEALTNSTITVDGSKLTNVTVNVLFTYPQPAENVLTVNGGEYVPAQVLGAVRSGNTGVTMNLSGDFSGVTVNSSIQIDSVVSGRIREVSVSTPAQLLWFNGNYGSGKLIEHAGEGLSDTLHIRADIDMEGNEWIPLDGNWLAVDGHGYTISNLVSETNSEGKAGFFGGKYAGNISNLTINGFIGRGSQVGAFAGHDVEGGKLINCHLKGEINITYVDGYGEKCGGVGAAFGVVDAGVAHDVTIDSGCVVTITFENEVVSGGFAPTDYVLGSAYGGNTGSYTANNGTIKVQQGTASVNDYALVYSGEYDGEYVVYSVEGLEYFRSLVNDDGVSFAGKTVALGGNIKLSESKIGGGTNWEPIGSTDHPFYGTFDGRDYTISNLVNTSGKSELGLFGFASQWEGSNGGQRVEAHIINLTIENVTLKGDAHVAAVVGTLVYGSIENVRVIGTIHVEAKTHAAGVVGLCYGELKDLHVDGGNGVVATADEPSWNIHATQKAAGGIVGGYAGTTALSDLSAEHISVFVDGVNTEDAASTDVGYAGGIAGVVVEQKVQASGLEVRDVKVGAGKEGSNEAAAQNAGALVGSVVAGGGLTLDNYYVSTDSEIVDENQDVVKKTVEGEDAPVEEQGNDAPVVGGSFTLPEENVIWLDNSHDGMTVVYKGVKNDAANSKAQYIEVYTAEGLQAWNALVNGEEAENWLSVDVRIKSNITLAANEAGNWTPVGTDAAPFTGNFDGEGHTIDGIHVVNLDREFAGFFGVVDGNVIENTSFANSMIDNKYNDGKVAVVAGRVMGATTLNGLVVKDSCVVSSEKVGGGLVGYVKDDEKWGEGDLSAADAPKVLITNCTNYASVTAKEKVGGIVGHIQHSNVTFSHCVNHGNLTATGNSDKKVETNAGGMVAYVMRSAKTVVEYCSNYGTISATACGAMTSSKLNVGGIIGTTHQGDFEFTEVANYGEIIATAEPGAKIQPKVGGIVGSSSQSDKMNGVISKGNITCTTNDTQRAVAGGIMGWEDGGSLTVTNAEIDCTITAINKGEAVGVALAGSVVAFVTKSAPVSISDVKISVTINPVNESTYTILGGTDSKDYAVSLTNTTLTLVYASDEEGNAGFTQDFSWNAEGAVTVGEYHIYNLAGLKAFRDSVNAGNTYAGLTILLEDDINLKNEEWTPIAAGNSSFCGTFNGQDYVISNLFISKKQEDAGDGRTRAGLFGTIAKGGSVCNLILDTVSITTEAGSLYTYTGCVAGSASGGSLAGEGSSLVFSNITLRGVINIDGRGKVLFHVGGVVGHAWACIFENITIEAAEGSAIYTQANMVGGVVGFCEGNGVKLTHIRSNLDVNASNQAGGVIGIGSYGTILEDVVVTANITARNAGNMGGAIIGSTQYNNYILNDVHFIGTVHNTTDTYYGMVGAPYAKTDSVVISNSTLVYVYADGFTRDIVWDETGAVTEYAYHISSADGLNSFRDRVNGGETFKGATVYLEDNVDLNGEDWTPIGTSEFGFAGIFDGNGYTISNVNPVWDGGSYLYTGFFSSLSGATVRNLTIDGATIKDVDYPGDSAGHVQGYIGIVAGRFYTGTMTNVVVKNGTIENVQAKYIGGLTGHGYVHISNCGYEGVIKPAAGAQIGGIIGMAASSVEGCYANVQISGKYSIAGGIVGFANPTEGCHSVSNCYVAGNITATGTYYGQNVGGIVGYGWSITVSNCYCDAEVGGDQFIAANCAGDYGTKEMYVIENCSWSAEADTCVYWGYQDAKGQSNPSIYDEIAKSHWCSFRAGMSLEQFMKTLAKLNG